MEILLPIGQGTDNTAQMPTCKYPLAYQLVRYSVVCVDPFLF